MLRNIWVFYFISGYILEIYIQGVCNAELPFILHSQDRMFMIKTSLNCQIHFPSLFHTC